MKKSPNPFRRLALCLVGTLFLATSANAAITLTINTWDRTFTWSGAVTTANFTIGDFENETYRLGSVGFATGGSSGQGAGGLGMSYTGGENFEPLIPGKVYVDNTAGASVFTFLGEANFSGLIPPETISLTLTGNGSAYSYMWAGITQEEIDFYTTLNGTQLYLQRWSSETGNDYANLGPAIGQVVLIPEPSSAPLALGASGLLLRRRRM